MPETTPQIQFGEDYNTAQIYSRGFEFAFMARPEKKGPYQQATTFVYCKDFLHDAVWAFLNKTKCSIYGFHYDYSKDLPLLMTETALAFRNTAYKKKPEEFHECLNACLEFLQGIDEILGLEPTQIFKVENEDWPCWFVLGDAKWQLAPTMISLYTLLIRIGFFHKPGDDVTETINRAEKGKIKIGTGSEYAGNRDCSYVGQARKGIDVILKHGTSVFYADPKKNYPKELLKNGLHDNYGIVNFTQGRPKKIMPHWYRSKLWK